MQSYVRRNTFVELFRYRPVTAAWVKWNELAAIHREQRANVSRASHLSLVSSTAVHEVDDAELARRLIARESVSSDRGVGSVSLPWCRDCCGARSGRLPKPKI